MERLPVWSDDDYNELTEAVNEFRTNYERYAAKHDVIRLSNIGLGTQTTLKHSDVAALAQFFIQQISNILDAAKAKQQRSETKWIAVLGDFLSRLYSLMTISLEMTSDIAQVYRSQRAVCDI